MYGTKEVTPTTVHVVTTIASHEDDLATCVGCGLCLPHCPTYRISGDESRSPRGRIEIMRALHSGRIEPSPTTDDALDSCIQCRGCEPACPSGVPYGRMISFARHDLVTRRPHRLLGLGLSILRHHRLLVAGSRLVALAQRLRLVPRSFLPRRLPLSIGRLPAPSTGRPDVIIWTGCVMDAWDRATHRRTAAVVAATDSSFAFTPGMCCGALHHHAGHEVRAMVERVIDEVEDAESASATTDAPVLVNSAGCGAMMKEYGQLLGTPAAHRFSARVVDVNEWLVDRLDRLPPVESPRPSVIVQDPCHLRHVQRVHPAMRRVIAHVADAVELDDDGLCCGAGGSYSLTHRAEARALRRAKAEVIARADRGRRLAIVSANPGCATHLSGLGHEVLHPIDLVARSLATRDRP